MKSKAFTKYIGPSDPGQDDLNYIHQSSPSWVLTVVRWDYRDTLRTAGSQPFKVREPLIIENDCVNVQVSSTKGSLTPGMSATLLNTDINYGTAIEPGDFVFVNMLNWEADARRVASQVQRNKSINNIADGFKGLYKVQSVRKVIQVDPSSGTKSVVTRIDGFAFTEFNNSIYFNPNLVNQKNLSNIALYTADVAATWSNLVSKKGVPSIQDIIAMLIQCFIGSGIGKAADLNGLVVSPTTHFAVPLVVGNLLGVSGVKTEDETDGVSTSVVAAKDIYRYLFGIQKYSGAQGASLAQGMNPKGLTTKYTNFYYCPDYVGGNSLLKPEYWNQVKLWSIMNQYTNTPLNELYTCFRISPNGRVMPTVVFRQIPFTTEDFSTQTLGVEDATANSIPVTKFMNLPRWKISPSMVYSLDIGRDEAARINFVQYYAKSNVNDKGIEISGETARGNYVYDAKDVKRSGLRPYVVNNQFDDLPSALEMAAPRWARVLGDALIGGHLKLNGSITLIGVVDPIAIGDNLEFDGIVFHIESVSHSCVINIQDGSRQFRTTIALSNGMDVRSSSAGSMYAEMENVNAYNERDTDSKGNAILPGVSESQDIDRRQGKIDEHNHINSSFAQPNPAPKKGDRK